MESMKDVKNSLSYIHSELMRMETMAGTLSTIEREHYRKLTNFSDQRLMDLAIEEQTAARQLATMKQMCLAMAQKVEGIEQAIGSGLKETLNDVQSH